MVGTVTADRVERTPRRSMQLIEATRSAMNEGPLWQFEAILGLVCVIGALWVVTTGRLVDRRITGAAERITRAGAMACLGVAALSQAAQHWIGHGVQLAIVGLIAAAAALALGSWSWAARRRAQ